MEALTPRNINATWRKALLFLPPKLRVTFHGIKLAPHSFQKKRYLLYHSRLHEVYNRRSTRFSQQQFARRGGNKAWARRTLTFWAIPGFGRAHDQPPAGRNFASVGPTVRPVDPGQPGRYSLCAVSRMHSKPSVRKLCA